MFFIVRKFIFYCMRENQSVDVSERERRSNCESLPPDVGEMTGLQDLIIPSLFLNEQDWPSTSRLGSMLVPFNRFQGSITSKMMPCIRTPFQGTCSAHKCLLRHSHTGASDRNILTFWQEYFDILTGRLWGNIFRYDCHSKLRKHCRSLIQKFMS